jgi:hypothetical protein
MQNTLKYMNITNSVALVRERTIPTEKYMNMLKLIKMLQLVLLTQAVSTFQFQQQTEVTGEVSAGYAK